MILFNLLILALVQGVTEFLPISSSAHLILLHEVGVTIGNDIALDVAVELIHRRAPALNGLQKHAAAVAEDAGNAGTRVVLARLREDGVDGFGRIVDGAAGVKQAYQHVSAFQE